MKRALLCLAGAAFLAMAPLSAVHVAKVARAVIPGKCLIRFLLLRCLWHKI